MTNTINENKVTEENNCCGNKAEDSCCCGETKTENSCNCSDDAEGCNCSDDAEGCNCSDDAEGCNCSDDTEGCACGNDHDHEHHDHDHDHGDHVHTVTFENEDGTTEEYPIVDEFEIDGVVYVLVMNADETVTPLRVEGEEGELIFLNEEEFEAVSEAYSNLIEDDEEDDSEVEPDLQ